MQAVGRQSFGGCWQGSHHVFGSERCGANGAWDVVMALTPADFYKSMTTHADYKVWQDVYRPSTQAGDVYLKLTVIDDVLIVSFKEL